MTRKTTKAKRQVKADLSSTAILGGALLSDSIAQTDSGKVHAQGIFTMFWAWGFPCARNWFLTLTIFGLSKGKTSIVVGIRKAGDTSETSLAVVDAEVNEDDSSSTLAVQLSHSFEDAGRYEVVCSIRGSTSTLAIPVDVREKAWVEYTDEERAFVKDNPQTPRNLRANVHCKQCSYAYIFEETILNEKPKGGVNSFPDDGQFECKDCGHVMNLRDVQGRLRASLKELVQLAMRRD
jgi:hypothetical protein